MASRSSAVRRSNSSQNDTVTPLASARFQTLQMASDKATATFATLVRDSIHWRVPLTKMQMNDFLPVSAKSGLACCYS